MARNLNFAAIDLGAESGRVMLGHFDGERVGLSEIHRFASAPAHLPDGLHTDVLHIWTEVKKGLEVAVNKCKGELTAIGVDTWGVDFALLDGRGALLANPYHYRNGPGPAIFDEAFQIVSRMEIFEQTGIQFMPINSLFQLFSLKVQESPLLGMAKTFLMMPDLFNYWLSGQKFSEFSIATTSQCYDPGRGDWAKTLLQKFGLPTYIFPRIISPGTVLGNLLPQVAEEIGQKDTLVVAPGCHDTALAVAAVPATQDDFVYISSGTWSLLGAELREPCINERSLNANFTNEGGVKNTFRFLKNITGLWLVQECRREWAHEGEDLSYSALIQKAEEAKALQAFVDVDDPSFAPIGDMPGRICRFCKETGQPVPDSKGAIIRCVLESLAFKYRQILEQLELILDHKFECLHIIGGGSQNKLLCQFAADATGKTVITGPVEATAIGNVLMQALALGHLGELEDLRSVVRRSFEVTEYIPSSTGAWADAYPGYLSFCK